jgi:hypothetical protein
VALTLLVLLTKVLTVVTPYFHLLPQRVVVVVVAIPQTTVQPVVAVVVVALVALRVLVEQHLQRVKVMLVARHFNLLLMLVAEEVALVLLVQLPYLTQVVTAVLALRAAYLAPQSIMREAVEVGLTEMLQMERVELVAVGTALKMVLGHQV